jgi:hypothetical protein
MTGKVDEAANFVSVQLIELEAWYIRQTPPRLCMLGATKYIWFGKELLTK